MSMDTHRRDAVVEDVTFLLSVGVDREELARRVGYRCADYLRTQLKRWGRRELADRLVVEKEAAA